MADHMSYMLDTLITAVDQSLSYDGIVSVPETGLEDVKPKCSLADSLRDGVDRVRISSAVISRGAAKVLKPKRQHTHPLSDDVIREKNHSEQSLTCSDVSFENPTDVPDEKEKPSVPSAAHSESGERNHFAQSYRTPKLGDDETDMAYGCLARPSFNRSRSDPISRERIHASRPERKEVEEEWHVVLPVDASEGESLGKNGEEGRNWRTRFKRGLQGGARSVQLSEVKQEGLRESAVQALNVLDRERPPTQKSVGDSGRYMSSTVGGSTRNWDGHRMAKE